MNNDELAHWVYFITTAGSLVRRTVFFCFFSYGTNVRPSTAKRIFQTFKSPALFLANAACGAERESRFSWLTRWRPSVAEPGAHALAWLLALASALAPQRRRGPQASPLLDATGSLSARSRPVRRSCGAARAEMVAMAQAGSPPGDGLAARRRHRWLSASAPDSGNATHPAVKLQLCACAAAQSRTAVKSHDQHGSRRRAPARRFTLLFSTATLRTSCEL